jgi:hypothetical protein
MEVPPNFITMRAIACRIRLLIVKNMSPTGAKRRSY